MNIKRIKRFHFSIFFATIFIWLVTLSAVLYQFDLLGTAQQNALPAFWRLALTLTLIASFIVFLVGSNLLSYVLIARVLKIPREDLEQVIRERAIQDPMDGIPFAQKFYAWCVNVAYGKEA